MSSQTDLQRPPEMSDEAWRIYILSLDPKIQEDVKRAPKMTPEQAARLRRLWNQPPKPPPTAAGEHTKAPETPGLSHARRATRGA